MKILKLLLLTALMTVKWVFILAFWIGVVAAINFAVIALIAFVFSLAPAIVFYGGVAIVGIATVIWMGWEDAKKYV